MKTVTATVTYRACIEIQVPDNISEDDLREKIKDEADHQLNCDPIEPMIVDCSEEDLIE